MSVLSIEVEFLTGRCVAADVSKRERAEWPPHPGRLYMAMAAACFETGEAVTEVAALEWLETLPPPQIYTGDHCERSRHAVYVPVNDKVTATKSQLQTAPGLSRSKQERSFPTVVPEDPTVTYVWTGVEGVDEYMDALRQVCINVIRVGHSSSLVRVWPRTTDALPEHPAWYPTEGPAEIQLRIVGEGELDRLRTACGARRIDRFAELAQTIGSTKGESQRTAKAEFELEFGVAYKSVMRPPEPTPPVLGLWQGYTRDRQRSGVSNIVAGSHFDSQLLFLRKLDGPNLSVQDTLALTRRLRDAAMSHCEIQPPPTWLSGHEENGDATAAPHTAFLALPYVGGQHGDGHLMGLAIAVPKDVAPELRGEGLRGLLFDDQGDIEDPREIELKLGGLGIWTVVLDADAAAAKTLQNRTWVGTSSTWASVTPVVLDRFPRSNRSTDCGRWNAEVAETIAISCERAGLPKPISVEIDTTSWVRGVPRAVAKRRPLRDGSASGTTTRLGDGFPAMPCRPGKPSRPQVHVRIEFHERVVGPVVVGAGRFSGYGLCKPVASCHESER